LHSGQPKYFRRRPARPAHRHQAPTLIDCKFLKINSLDLEACCTPFTAPLLLQQRSEIIYCLLASVNTYLLPYSLSDFLAKPANPYQHWASGPASASL